MAPIKSEVPQHAKGAAIRNCSSSHKESFSQKKTSRAEIKLGLCET